MEKTKKNNFRLVGLKLENKTTNENNQSSTDCGNLWQQFEKEKIFELIPNKLTNEIYAVYFDYEKDETKPFSYFIGCQGDDDTDAPKGLDNLPLPAQNYRCSRNPNRARLQPVVPNPLLQVLTRSYWCRHFFRAREQHG